MTLFEKVYSLGCKFANEIGWPIGSSIRGRKAIRSNIELAESDKFTSLTELSTIISRLYSKFTYTKDGADQLYDSITPPPQNYKNYLDGSIKDDCDGFHSALYHIVKNNNIDCGLMSVNSIGSGHCVLLIKYEEMGRVIDYTHIYDGYATAEAAINSYNLIFESKYNAKKVLYNGFVTYDYDTGSFKTEKIK